MQEDNMQENQNKILFMFLGGLPSDNNVLEHWNKFLNNINISNLFIIVHPYKLNQNTIPLPFQKINNTGNLIITDTNHHISTAWATKSLTDATLLMMQYAIILKGNIFKKYVLLSSSCCPLYNFDVLYQILMENSQSWFYGRNEGYLRNTLIYSYKDQGGIFDYTDGTFWSQWFTLDCKHINLFLSNDTLINKKKTYEIIENDHLKKEFECISTGVKIKIHMIKSVYINDNYQKQLDSFNGGSTINEIKNKLPCAATDEYFFASIIKHYTSIEDFTSNFKITHIDDIEYLSKTKYINNINNKLVTIIEPKIYYPDDIKNDVWIGTEFVTNYKYFSKKTIEMCEDNILYEIQKNGDLVGNNFDTNRYKCENNILIDKNDYYPIALNNKLNGNMHKLDANWRLISSTYTDWGRFTHDPYNILRDLKIHDIIVTTKLELLPSEFFELFIKNPMIFNSTDLLDDIIKIPWYHPVEYTTWTLKSMINAYNICKYYYNNIITNSTVEALKYNDDNNHDYIRDYKRMNDVFNNWKIIITEALYNNYDAIEIINIDDIELFNIYNNNNFINKIYGVPITSSILNSALSYGALFIRKCNKDSYINIYSDALFMQQQYIPNKIKIRRNIPILQQISRYDNTIDEFIIESDYNIIYDIIGIKFNTESFYNTIINFAYNIYLDKLNEIDVIKQIKLFRNMKGITNKIFKQIIIGIINYLSDPNNLFNQNFTKVANRNYININQQFQSKILDNSLTSQFIKLNNLDKTDNNVKNIIDSYIYNMDGGGIHNKLKYYKINKQYLQLF
jgi:hypothetical protein